MPSRLPSRSVPAWPASWCGRMDALQPTRRQVLTLLPASVLAGCGGGDPDSRSFALSEGRDHAAAALRGAVRAGFVFLGPTQTLQIGSSEQFIPIGRFVSVLIAPLTPKVGVFAAPGVPAVLANDDKIFVAWPDADVLEVQGARGFNLRCKSFCTVTLFLGA